MERDFERAGWPKPKIAAPELKVVDPGPLKTPGVDNAAKGQEALKHVAGKYTMALA